jgi:hypothetical protein
MLLSHLPLLLHQPFSNSVCMARLHPIDRSLATDYMHEFFDSLLTSSVEPSSPSETTWKERALDQPISRRPTYLTKMQIEEQVNQAQLQHTLIK